MISRRCGSARKEWLTSRRDSSALNVTVHKTHVKCSRSAWHRYPKITKAKGSNNNDSIERPSSVFDDGGSARKREPLLSGIIMNRRSSLAFGSMTVCPCSFCRAHAYQNESKGHGNLFMKKIFASAMANGMEEYEAAIEPVKETIFSKLFQGEEGTSVRTLVEVGIGTGPNIKYYSNRSDLNVVGVDPNPYMKPYLYRNLDDNNFWGNRFEWKDGVAEALPFENGSVDAVVSTLVMCSVNDVYKSVSEIHRVLRPGGKLVFIEHVTAPPERFWLGVAQTLFDPLQQLLADNCHLRRNPLMAIHRTGFADLDFESFEVEGMSLISPHVSGIAVK